MSNRPEQYWGTNSNGRASDASAKDLFSSVTREAQALARQEAELAKVEVKKSLASASRAGAMFGGGGLMAFLALQALTVAAGFGLATTLPAWLAFLIVAIVYLVVTGLLLAIGRKHLAGVEPPRRTIDTVKADIRTAKEAFTNGMKR